MPFKPVSEMTRDEREAHRAYMRQKKAESRERKRQAKKCIVCGGATPAGTVSCPKCNNRSTQWAKQNGYTMGPSKKMIRKGRKLFEAGYTTRTIAIRLGIAQEFVVDWLHKSGFRIKGGRLHSRAGQ